MLVTVVSQEESVLERWYKITAVLYRWGHAVSQMHRVAIAAAKLPLCSSPFHIQKGDDILMKLASFQREKSLQQSIPNTFQKHIFIK